MYKEVTVRHNVKKTDGHTDSYTSIPQNLCKGRGVARECKYCDGRSMQRRSKQDNGQVNIQFFIGFLPPQKDIGITISTVQIASGL